MTWFAPRLLRPLVIVRYRTTASNASGAERQSRRRGKCLTPRRCSAPLLSVAVVRQAHDDMVCTAAVASARHREVSNDREQRERRRAVVEATWYAFNASTVLGAAPFSRGRSTGSR